MAGNTKDIIHRLETSGYMTEMAYTHDRLLDDMKGFEQAALREVFREGYSDSLRAYDLAAHFRDMASKYALCDTEVYGHLSLSLHRLSREISSLVNGARGERYMARALSWLKCENELLLNVELEYEGERCEYDAIVIAPTGIDIVESRFFNFHAVIEADGFFHNQTRSRERSYNVGEKMRAKEHVLFNVIEAAAPGAVSRSCIRSIFFVANNNAIIQDRFGLVDVCNSGEICPLIERRKDKLLDCSIMAAVVDAIEDARQTFLYEPALDFDQLRSDIADFIVMTERASARSATAADHSVEIDVPVTNHSVINRSEIIPEVVRAAAAVVLSTLGLGAAGYGIIRLSRWAV